MKQPTHRKNVTMAEIEEWYKKDEILIKGTAIISLDPLFGQIPIELLRDPNIKPSPKALFGVYHSCCCNAKKLKESPLTFASQKRIAEEFLGSTQQAVSKWTRDLSEAEWLTVIRQGQGRSNIIVLHDRKGKKISKRLREMFIEKVRFQQASYNRHCN